DELAGRVRVRHAVEAELVQPLPAAAAGRGGDRYLLQLPRAVALGHGAGEGRALGADAERVGGVLDVDAGDDAAVAGAHGGADVEARVRRVGPLGGRARLLEERHFAS